MKGLNRCSCNAPGMTRVNGLGLGVPHLFARDGQISDVLMSDLNNLQV